MASFTVADGPLGREATHAWGDGSTFSVVLNDLAAWPRFIVDRIDGIGSLPEVDDNRVPLAGQMGELALPTQKRGRTITYTLRVVGRSLQELRQGVNALKAAAGDNPYGELRQMTLTPAGAHSGQAWFYTGRVLSLTDGDELTSSGLLPAPWQQQIVLSVRLMDPRIYAAGAASAAIADGASATVTNLGTAPVDPILVFGPCTSPRAFHAGQSADLSFPGLVVPSGKTLIADFAAGHRSAKLSDGTDVMRYLDADTSKWWHEGYDGLRRGANLIGAVTGALTVNWHHGSW